MHQLLLLFYVQLSFVLLVNSSLQIASSQAPNTLNGSSPYHWGRVSQLGEWAGGIKNPLGVTTGLGKE
jgi:hypothetical protein